MRKRPRSRPSRRTKSESSSSNSSGSGAIPLRTPSKTNTKKTTTLGSHMPMNVSSVGLTDYDIQNGLGKSASLTGVGDGAFLGNALGNTSTRSNNQFDRLALSANIFRPPEIKFKDLETIVTTKLSFNLLPFNF